MKDKVVHYEGRLERMQHDFDEMQTAYSKMRNELDTVKQELKKSQASEERLKKELKQTKAELIHYKGSYEFMCRLLQSECHHEDVLRGMRKAMEKEGGVTTDDLKNDMKRLMSLMDTSEEVAEAQKQVRHPTARSMLTMLNWLRSWL